MRHIAEQWQGFEEKVLSGDDIQDVQKQEMRKAFFSGAGAMFGMINIMAMDGEECDIASFMEEVEKELNDFLFVESLQYGSN